MQTTTAARKLVRNVACGMGLLLTAGSVGCQYHVGGQSLPSGYYNSDDVQYFPPGPEFKLSREAAAQKAFGQDQAAQAAQPRR